jgi:hypothetical protein
MDEEEVENTISWLNIIPLSRRTGNLARDFSDGVMLAEILKYYYPRHVDLHNYPPVFKRASKFENWFTLNKKVLRKLDIGISVITIEKIVSGEIDAVLNLLTEIRLEIEKAKEGQLEDNSDSSQMTPIPSRSLSRRVKSKGEIDNHYLPLLLKMDQDISAKERLIKTLTQTASDLESQVKSEVKKT